MPRQTPMTYRGALALLGRHDRPVLTTLNRLLGGAILAAGIPGAAMFGWVDQKNEAVDLVHRLLDAATDRLHGTAGVSRHRLIAAAHTTIVGAALFEALRQVLGDAAADLEITAAEQRRVGVRAAETLESLYSSDVPTPSAARGFHETLDEAIGPYLAARTRHLLDFLDGLAAWQELRRHRQLPANPQEAITRLAADLYAADFRRLAADVPEFALWAVLGEHAATRSLIRAVNAAVAAALDGETRALGRLEALLSANRSVAPPRPRDPRAALHAVNRGALAESLVRRESVHHAESIEFPTIEHGYIPPSFHVAVNGPHARPSHERWWSDQPKRHDLDAFLAAHVGTPASTTLPLLMLGHPGAGKSLLTRVMAAQLPPDAYTVVWVPLRRVDADAPIYEQIAQALRSTTHGRVEWAELTAAAKNTVRVVLLDGFDELLQASSMSRSGYLQQVADFQRAEAAMDSPVIVMVTSRTLVVERATIPQGCVMLKLNDFDDEQLGRWLDVWRATNLVAVEAGRMRAPTLSSALRYEPMSRQPLLLLMLALYAADPAAPDLDAGTVSQADLYGGLLGNFIRREVTKQHEEGTPEFDAAVRSRSWHLGVAAFGMFNRGQREISEDNLNADLAALSDPPRRGRLRPARRTIAEFFFVHTAQSDGNELNPTTDVERTYEFMHATFEEYLVAEHTVRLLRELSGWLLPPGHRIDDHLLFALLSHQTLTIRERIVPFVEQLIGRLPAEERTRVIALLDRLIGQVHRRPPTQDHAAYPPMSDDPLRMLAAYSANLVLLRVYGSGSVGMPIADVAPQDADHGDWWRSTVWLWHAGLDAECRRTLVERLRFSGAAVVAAAPVPDGLDDIVRFEYLAGGDGRHLRAGFAVIGEGSFDPPTDDALFSYFVFLRTYLQPIAIAPELSTAIDISGPLSAGTARAMLHGLRRLHALGGTDHLAAAVRRLLPSIGPDSAGPAARFVALEWASLVMAHPDLLDEVAKLNDARLYRPARHESTIILRLTELSLPPRRQARLSALVKNLEPVQAVVDATRAELLEIFWEMSRGGVFLNPQ